MTAADPPGEGARIPAADAGPATVLDLRGLNCPMPVLKSRRALARLAVGERIEVLATDPLAALDLTHLCREDGHELVGISTEGGLVRAVIRKRPPLPMAGG